MAPLCAQPHAQVSGLECTWQRSETVAGAGIVALKLKRGISERYCLKNDLELQCKKGG